MQRNDARYMADYRARNPDYARRNDELKTIRRAAALIVAKRYPQEYRALIEQICREKGIEPPREH